MAGIIPEGMLLSDFIDSISDHGSRYLRGYVDNSATGARPVTLFNQPFAGSRNIDGFGKIFFNIRMAASIDGTGQGIFTVSDVNIYSKPKHQLGAIKFLKNSRLLITAAPSFSFRNSLITANENDTNAIIPVYRSNDLSTTNSVRITTADEDANSSDYFPVDKVVTFLPGKDHVNVPVKLKNNTVVDKPQNRRFSATLSNPSPGTFLVGRTFTEVSIHDDEVASPFGFPGH